MTSVGLVSPGSMGAAVGACLMLGGSTVLWASAGRSASTRERATDAGFRDVGDLGALCEASDLLLSICPPKLALPIARAVADRGFAGVYVEANAIAPVTASECAALVAPSAAFVDGGIIGGPPRRPGTTRLYLAGDAAEAVATLFEGGPLAAVVLDGPAPAASALKMAFAAWTKGSAALLLAARAFAAAENVEADLLVEWARSHPDLAPRSEGLARQVGAKAWRWVGEMIEIAEAFAAVGLPDGLHLAAAEMFDRLAGRQNVDDVTVAEVLADLLIEQPHAQQQGRTAGQN